MKRILSNCKFTYQHLNPRQRLLFWTFSFWLTALAATDAFSLQILSSVMKNASSQSLFDKAPELLLVAGLFVGKNIVAGLATFLMQRFFQKIEIQLGEENLKSFASVNWKLKRTISDVDFVNLVDRGPFSAVRGVLYSTVTLSTELISAIAVVATLFVNNFLVATVILTYFFAVMQIQNLSYGRIADRLGKQTYLFTNQLFSLMMDFHKIGKVLTVNPSQGLVDELNRKRRELIPVRASQSFVESLPRYYVEAVLVTGLMVVSAVSLIAFGPNSIFASITLFAAAGYRLLPTLSRIQAGISFSRMNLDLAETGPEFRSKLKTLEPESRFVHWKKNWIEFDEVTFSYPGSKEEALKNFTFKFKPGKKYALVGPSGSGKTTIADMCLGLWQPTSGRLCIPIHFTKSYVPQENEVLSGSLEKNLLLDNERKAVQSKLNSALTSAGLDSKKLKNHFESSLAKSDTVRLSGGQKQRLGIARAIYRGAELQIFDEATSALDNKMESTIMKAIGKAPKGKISIVIAHRLSTVRDADEILYISNGRLIGHGSWHELLANLPEFAEQVKLGELK